MGRRQGGVRGGARARGVRQALFGLGVTLWWLGETEASLRHRERAYAVFRRRPDHEQAVLAAFYLCLAYRMSLGDHAASRGWLGRAAGLVEELALGPLNGWVLVGRAYLATDGWHPQAGERRARQARAIARESGDADLELCAMSELGAALVELGRIEEGTALLDEAMAGALAGEGRGLDTVVLIACRTITSCSRGGDLARATQWVRVADEFHRRYGSPHLYTTCRTQYGGILLATGRWEQAEEELQAALRIGRAAEPALHCEALAGSSPSSASRRAGPPMLRRRAPGGPGATQACDRSTGRCPRRGPRRWAGTRWSSGRAWRGCSRPGALRRLRAGDHRRAGCPAPGGREPPGGPAGAPRARDGGDLRRRASRTVAAPTGPTATLAR